MHENGADASFFCFGATEGNTTKTRLKQFTAIGLICIFALAQMARYVPYLECRAMNMLRPASQVCDCEKLADENLSNLPNPNHSPSHHLIRMDEYFEITSTSLQRLISSSTVFILKNETAWVDGYYADVWKPPDFAVLEEYFGQNDREEHPKDPVDGLNGLDG